MENGNTEKRKNTKKIAFICIAINIILLLQLCLGTVMALDENTAYTEPEHTIEAAVIDAQGGEMQIMAAASCPNVWENNANKWNVGEYAQYYGYAFQSSSNGIVTYSKPLYNGEYATLTYNSNTGMGSVNAGSTYTVGFGGK